MKIDNKYNIGDYVWVGKNTPTCHRIKALEIFVRSDIGTSVSYVLEGIPPEYCGFREDECFLSQDECIKQENYATVKATKLRVNKVIVRLCLITVIMIIVVPFLLAQAIYWLFTGRKDYITYRVMNKICNVL